MFRSKRKSIGPGRGLFTSGRPQRERKPTTKFAIERGADPNAEAAVAAAAPTPAKPKKLKLVGANATAASVSPPPDGPPVAQPTQDEGDLSPLTSLGGSDEESFTPQPGPSRRGSGSKAPPKPKKAPKAAKAVKQGSRSSKRGRSTEEPESVPVVEPEVAQPESKKKKKTAKVREPTPEDGEEPSAGAALAAGPFTDAPAPIAAPIAVVPQPIEPAPVPVAAPAPSRPSPPPAKKSEEKLNPKARPFSPSRPPSTKPAPPAAAPAPAPALAAPKSSIFAAKTGGTPNPLRKKPTPSVFAPKPVGQRPAGQPTKVAEVVKEDKGASIFASLVGSQKVEAEKKAPPKDTREEALARMRVAKKPQMTAEERLADAAKRRLSERAARQEDQRNRFDLLEQAIAMNSFEEQYRLEVRKKAKEIVDKEGVRFPLPRLTTYGSLFSIWPRREEPRLESET